MLDAFLLFYYFIFEGKKIVLIYIIKIIMADKRGADYNKRLNYDELKDKITKKKNLSMLPIVQQQLFGIVIKCKIYYK